MKSERKVAAGDVVLAPAHTLAAHLARFHGVTMTITAQDIITGLGNSECAHEQNKGEDGRPKDLHSSCFLKFVADSGSLPADRRKNLKN